MSLIAFDGSLSASKNPLKSQSAQQCRTAELL